MKAIIRRKSAKNESPPPKTTASINESEEQLVQVTPSKRSANLINNSLDAL